MGFKIAEGEGRTYWAATDGSSTYYMGQIVTAIAASKANTPGTCLPLAVPAGVADTTNFQVPIGIVVGFNDAIPTYSNGIQYTTGVLTQAAQLARSWTGNEGMYAKGDPQVLVQIAEILPHTVIEGPICNAALGTAPTVVTSTAADTTGWTSAGTTGSCDFTPVANICTVYCRKGTNKGLYRTTNDTSATAPDVTVAFPYDVAIGDTFVRVPMKQGRCDIYIGGPGLYIDCSLTATNNFAVLCYELDLEVAGQERAYFRFMNMHFDNARA